MSTSEFLEVVVIFSCYDFKTSYYLWHRFCPKL